MSAGISFLQSKEWGDFQTAVGHRLFRFDEIQGYEYRLWPGMRYVYVPRCNMKHETWSMLWDSLKKEGFAFARLEPIEEFHATGFMLHASENRQPQHTLLIDLSKTEEEILAGFHPKTRYNVHLAERHGVVVREEKNVEIFWKLHEETASRDKFRGHSKTYYEKMLAMPIAHQLTAYLGDVPIASHLLIVFGGKCTYLHGASSNEHRNLMAPYLLQWEGMKLGKYLGCRSYDMWGVAPPAQSGSSFHGYTWDPTHPWSGITRFKAGFGGMPVSYPPAVDVILSPFRYRLYRFVRRMRGVV